jgi:hypothetical protein
MFKYDPNAFETTSEIFEGNERLGETSLPRIFEQKVTKRTKGMDEADGAAGALYFGIGLWVGGLRTAEMSLLTELKNLFLPG